jgi:hypothetical protein
LPSTDDPYGILEARLTLDFQPYTAVNCILVEEIINQLEDLWLLICIADFFDEKMMKKESSEELN